MSDARRSEALSTQNHRDERPGDAERHSSVGRKGASRSQRFALLSGLTGVVVGSAVIVAISNVLAGPGALQAAPQRTALNPPTDLYGSSTSDGTVLLSWQPKPPPVGYRIYRAAGRHRRYTIVGEAMSPDMDTFTDSSDLRPGTTYAYTVTAFDRHRHSAPVGPISALVLGAPGPTPIAAVPAPLLTFAAHVPPTLTALARTAG
jgi:Fibronectin type III domain